MLIRKEFDVFKCDACGREEVSKDGDLPGIEWIHFYDAEVSTGRNEMLTEHPPIVMKDATFCDIGCLQNHLVSNS